MPAINVQRQLDTVLRQLLKRALLDDGAEDIVMLVQRIADPASVIALQRAIARLPVAHRPSILLWVLNKRTTGTRSTRLLGPVTLIRGPQNPDADGLEDVRGVILDPNVTRLSKTEWLCIDGSGDEGMPLYALDRRAPRPPSYTGFVDEGLCGNAVRVYVRD